VQDGEYRIDIVLTSLLRVGGTFTSGDQNDIHRWVTDELFPILKKYSTPDDRLDMQTSGERWTIRLTGSLSIPDSADLGCICQDIKRKVAIVLDSKGFIEEQDYSIQVGPGRYDPDEYGDAD